MKIKILGGISRYIILIRSDPILLHKWQKTNSVPPSKGALKKFLPFDLWPFSQIWYIHDCMVHQQLGAIFEFFLLKHLTFPRHQGVTIHQLSHLSSSPELEHEPHNCHCKMNEMLLFNTVHCKYLLWKYSYLTVFWSKLQFFTAFKLQLNKCWN